jgi:hypothetical protein
LFILLEQRAFAPVADVVAYVAQCGAGGAKDDTVPGLVVLLIGIESRVVTHPVAYTVVIVEGVVVLHHDPVYLAGVLTNCDSVFGVVLYVVAVPSLPLPEFFLRLLFLTVLSITVPSQVRLLFRPII